MTVREWAVRVGLGDHYYTNVADDDGVCSEAVLVMRHCLDCADWFVFRESDGRLFKTGPDGSHTLRVEITDANLDSLELSYWSR